MRYKISKTSERGRLMKDCDKLHLEILKLKRGEKCEISSMPANRLGRFHILSTATHPRLRYVDDNLLLVNWFPWHYGYHHWGLTDPRNKTILNKIIELRGPDWHMKLLDREKYSGHMDKLYLLALRETFKKELKSLQGG